MLTKIIDFLFRSWVGLILNTIIAILLGFFILQNFFNDELAERTRHGQHIEVPNLENLSPAQAQAKLAKVQLQLAFRDTVYSAKHLPGNVIAQNPKPLAVVKQDRRVYVTLNTSDKPTVTITKDLLSKIVRSDVNSVTVRLKALGLTYRVDTINNPYKDYVLFTKFKGKALQAGQKIEKGSSLQLIIGNGRKEDEDEFVAP